MGVWWRSAQVRKNVPSSCSGKKTADTLMTVFRDWNKPGTTVISDCWSAYRDIQTYGYTHTHPTVNHTIGFVDVRTGAHTKTIASTWRHVKAFLNPDNRMGDIIHLANYMFAAGCRPTTWTSSQSSSASLQARTGASNLPSIAVMSPIDTCKVAARNR